MTGKKKVRARQLTAWEKRIQAGMLVLDLLFETVLPSRCIFFFAMTHWKEKLSIEKNSHYRFDQSRTFLNVSIHKITFGKDSLCLLNCWETEKKKKLPVAQKKNITNVFIVLSGLKKWHHQFSACFTWNGRRREAAFAGPSLCKEHRVAGCFPSTVHWPPSEQEPHPRPQGSLLSYS